MVIPTKDRPALVGPTLDALGRQTLGTGSFEVVLVDDGSGPEARRALQRLAPPFAFRLIHKPAGGLAAARNAGAAEARGALLLFLDDDVRLAPGALSAHVAAHAERRGPAAVVGALDFSPEIPDSAFLHYLIRIGHYDVYRDKTRYPEGFPPVPPVTGNTSMPASALASVGGYDESFTGYGGEDLDMGYRLQRAGVPIVYCPQAFGHHHHPKDFAQFCLDMQAAGESLIQVYRKHPDIRAAKKIDVVEDPIAVLPTEKKLIKAILSISLAVPGVMEMTRRALEVGAPYPRLRQVLFPLFRWVAHYHYALGMRKGLAGRP